MLKIDNVDASETTADGDATDSGMDAVLLAQADTGGDPAGTPPSASGGAPGVSVIVPDADNRVTLAASASIEDIQLDGNDLLLVQPDGSQIRIIGGALSVPTFVIGDIEVPQEVLVAALETSGFNVAAGPGNTLSVSPQAPTGSGGEFGDSSDATIIDGQLQTLGLLGDDAASGAGDGAGDEIIEPGNVASVLGGGVSAGEIIESADNPGGVDADPVAATGSITFFDPDFGETRTAEIAASNVVSQVLKSGGTLTAAQLDALLAGFSLDTPGGITVESTTAAGGSIDWTYQVGNDAIDFLASGEVIMLSFEVRINDGIFSVTQTVTITVTGTNDQPVIEATSVLTDTITEQTDTTGVATSLTATGQIVLSDVDVSDTHTASQSFVSAVWSGGINPTADPGALVIGAVDQSTETADWTYAIADSALDFLSAGETLTITYDVTVQDDSGTGNASSASRQIVVTITGTKDVPVIDVTTGASTSELVDSTLSLSAVTAFGQMTFTDVDLSDTGHSASVVGAVSRSGESDGLSILGFPLPDSVLRAFLNIDAVSKPAGSADGTIDYRFSAADLTFDYLAKGQSVTLTYTVELTDGDGGVTTQQVPITITGTNDRPEILFAATASGRENRNLTGSDASETHNGIMLFFDADRDDVGHSADAVFAGATGVTAGLDISLIDNAVSISSVSKAINSQIGSLRWNFSAVDRAFDYLSAGQQVTLTYTVTLDDNEAETNSSATSTVSVTITGTNDQPVITSVAQTGSVEETADVVGGVDSDPAAATGTISFLDVDLSDDPEASHDGGTVTNMSFAHGYTPTDAQIAALKAGFSLDDAALSDFSNTTGVGSTGWTYQVANTVVDFLGDGDSVELTYVVTIDDSNGGTVTQNVVITVTGTSDAPTVSASDNFVVNEEDLTNGNSGALIFTGDVGLNFNDYSSVGLSARIKTSGAVPLDPSGELILLKSDGQLLSYSLLTRPSEGIQRLAAFDFRTGEVIFVLEVKIVADGSGGFKVAYTFELRGNLDHVGPGDGNSMPLDFTVTATNSAGETASNTFTVTINDDTPDAADLTATMEENTVTVVSLVEGDGATVEAGEAYVSGADDVTVTLGTPAYSNLPAGVTPGTPGIALVQTATGYDVSITPGTAFDALAEGESLLMQIPFTVTDGDGDMVTKVISVTVTGTNDQPVITAVTDVSEILTETDAALSTTGSFDVADADTGDVLTITGVTVSTSGTGVNAATPGTAALLAMFASGSGPVIDGLSNTGTVNWTFDAGADAFDYLAEGEQLELTYSVNLSDGNGGTFAQEITITINGSNDAAVIAPIVQPSAVAEIADASAQDIAPVSGTLAVTDADVGDTLTAQAGTPVISWSGGTLSAAQQSALMVALGTGSLTLGSTVSNGGTVDIGYSWDPSAADLDFLAAGETLTVQYEVDVTDGTSSSTTRPLGFTIQGSNDAPVILSGQGNDIWLVRNTVDLVLENNGDGTFAAPPQEVRGASFHQESRGVDIGDIDGDGDLDAVVAYGYFGPSAAYLNDGTGVFTLSDSFGLYDVQNVALGDLNGDGKLDAMLVATGPATGIGRQTQVFLGNGDGTFTGTGQNIGYSGSFDVQFSDFDNDGDLDAIIANNTVTASQIWWNDGNGFFSTGPLFSDSQSSWGVSVGDVNADGFDDFILSGDTSKLYLNNGDGTFAPGVAAFRQETSSNGGTALADIDSDGDLDVFEIATDRPATVWLNDGHGNFSSNGQLALNHFGWRVAAGDLDNDGDVDFISTRANSDEVVWINDGNGQFTAVVAGLGGLGAWNVAIADFQSSLTGAPAVFETVDVPGGIDLNPAAVTGTIMFTDADLSDQPTAMVTARSVTMVKLGSGQTLSSAQEAELLNGFSLDAANGVSDSSFGDGAGEIAWTYETTNAVIDFLDEDDQLALTFTVMLDDGNGGKAVHHVTLTIEGTNDAPVISPITQPAAVAEAGNASAQDIAPVSGTLAVTDADVGDTLTAQAGTPVISWSGGTMSAAQKSALMVALGTGALTLGAAVSDGGAGGIGYSWDPAAADLDFLASGQTLTVAYDVVVSDGTATSASQPLVFTIQGTNDLPVARNDNPNGSLPVFRIGEDATVSRVFDVLGNDTLDPDAGSANSISLGTIRGYGVPGVASGGIFDPLASGFFTITVDVNNQIQVELNNSAWQSMRRGETAKIVIDYKLHGDGSDVATGTLQVEVTGSNDAPVLDVAASPAMTQAEDAGLPSGHVGTQVSTLVSAPGGSVGNVNDVDGKTFAPGMSITAFDTSQGVWYYHLDGVNASDGRPYWFNANLAPGQVLNLRAQDQLYFAPNADYVGTVDQAITFRAWDGVASQLGKISAPGTVGGGTAYSADTDTVSLTVENVNDAPVLVANIADKTVFSNTTMDIDVSGSFADIDPGDVLSYSATLNGGAPLPAWLSIDEVTGRLTGTPPPVGIAGETLDVIVTATDSGGLSVSDTFELAVDNAPVAPVITAHTDGGVTEDASFAGGLNLITNGGFETGTSGWVVTNSGNVFVSSYAPNVHSGGSAAGGWSVYSPNTPVTYSQTFNTVAGATYTIGFWAQNKGSHLPADNSVLVTWDGATVGSVIDMPYGGSASNYTEFSYTFTATSSSSTLVFAVVNNVNYTYLDDISVVQLPGTETTGGTISFSDADVGETHTVSFLPSAAGYLGTFSAAVGTESSAGSLGTVDWTFDVADADIQHLAAGETVTQTYTVTIDDSNSGTVSEDIDVTLTGVNDAPVLAGLDGATFLENTVNAAPQIIDADVAFADVDDGNLDTGTLTVSGFVSGEDTIGINDQGAGAGNITLSGANVLFDGTVIGTFAGGSGANNLVVTFNANATSTAVDALIQNLTFANASDTPVASRTLTITVTDGDGGTVSATSAVNVTAETEVPKAVASDDFIDPIPVGWTWLADNGHIYKYVSTNTVWSGAVTAAAGEIAGQSYLATSTSAAEDALIDTLATGRTHLGASDASTEGTWQWMTGPEAGQVFWIGGVGGAAQNGAFTNWSSGNPNNLSGGGGGAENYLATDLSDNWNDVSATNSLLPTIGYMAEAGGLNGQAYAAITEDAAFTFSESWLLANDANAPASILSVLSSTKGASVSYNAGTGEITYDATGSSILQALNAGETTTDTFTYFISDGNGGTSSSVVTLTVSGADEAPILGTAGDDVLLGDAGAELLNGGLGSDILYGGGEADTFVFDADALADAGANILDLIADYDFAEGDVVDLSSLLGGETVVGHAADYVKMNGAFLEVDVDGTAGGAAFVRIAEFTDVPATNGLRLLVDDDPADVTVVI